MKIATAIFSIGGRVRKMQIYNDKHFDTSLMRHYKACFRGILNMSQ
jgi:hypothetical protein